MEHDVEISGSRFKQLLKCMEFLAESKPKEYELLQSYWNRARTMYDIETYTLYDRKVNEIIGILFYSHGTKVRCHYAEEGITGEEIFH